MKVNWKRGRAALLIWGARLLLCLLVGGMLAGTGGVVVSRMWAEAVSRPRIVPLNQAPERDVAIVFGGGVYPNGVPSRALRVRLDTALQLYRRGRVRPGVFRILTRPGYAIAKTLQGRGNHGW